MNNKKMRKIIAIVLLSSIAIIGVTSSAFAREDVSLENSQITPRWSYIEATDTGLTISSGVATVDCWVKGDYYTATKAKVIAELQLKSGNSWMAYGTWTDIQNDYEACVYETKSVKTGQTYRVKATYTVWQGSQSESAVIYSDEVTA